MRAAIPYLESNPKVFRYSWFSADPIPNAKLMNSDGSPTALGQVYISLAAELSVGASGAFTTRARHLQCATASTASNTANHSGGTGTLLDQPNDALIAASTAAIRRGNWPRPTMAWVWARRGDASQKIPRRR